MISLLPRLPEPAAEMLLNEFLSTGPSAWPKFKASALPPSTRFAATGGSPVPPIELEKLRNGLEEIARNNGFGGQSSGEHAAFDAKASAWLADLDILNSGEALRDDVWAFIGVALAPDIVHWRFGNSRQRYLGGIRNTLQRLWLRGKALDRGAEHPDRWKLLHELSEDALVQITERPSLGADALLARAIGEAWVRASAHYGKGAMEPIMRRAALRIRIWNEVRCFVEVPTAELSVILDRAFGIEGGQAS